MQAARSLASDFGFEPCSDDRCSRVGLHPAHYTPDTKTLTICPECAGPLFKLPRLRGRNNRRTGARRAACSRCSWRGSIEKDK